MSAVDPVAHVALWLGVLVGAAKLAGALFEKLGQPAVLGELCLGLLLGNLRHLGVGAFAGLVDDPAIDLLARLGVVLLLFDVGLGTTVRALLVAGRSAVVAALCGVAGSYLFGWIVCALLLPSASVYTRVFLAASLTSTSVSVTARVLRDLGAGASREANVVLGASVVDDVLGLVVLSLVSALVLAAGQKVAPGYAGIARATLEAIGFLVGAIVIGRLVSVQLVRRVARLGTPALVLGLCLSSCLLAAWASSAAGLSPIIGAFAAGLVLEEADYAPERHEGPTLAERVRPIVELLAPVFFVVTGMRADLALLANPATAALAGGLLVAAILGKQLCAVGVARRDGDRLTVAFGMVPRGEVQLVYAGIGATLTVAGRPVVSASSYAALVAVVLGTTLVTPPLLKRRLARRPAA